VRPEHLRVAVDPQNEQTLACRVKLVEHMGEHSYIHATQTARDAATVIAKVPGDSMLKHDEAVDLSLPPESCHVFDDHDMALRRLT
jgi:multiple sugar transport system ATP-binding protein